MTTDKKFNDADIVRQAIPTADNIRMPNIRGAQKNVYLADTVNGTYVCKINHPDLAAKNMTVSSVLRAHKIPVPEVSLYCMGDKWCEVYKMAEGKTLHECVRDGMSPRQLHAIYVEAVSYLVRMSKINWRNYATNDTWHIENVARRNVTDVNGPVLGTIAGCAVRALNHGGAAVCGLYHAGLTPKNIIVGDDGAISALVDLDEVAVCNPDYAFGVMLAKYSQMPIFENKPDMWAGIERTLFIVNDGQNGAKINVDHVKKIADIQNKGREFLWKCANIIKHKVK